MSAFEVVPIDAAAWARHADAITAIEAESYEVGRRDSFETLDGMVHEPRAIALLALGTGVAGFAFAGPLEQFATVGGVREDPHWGRGDTLYAADVTVARSWRGRGVGRALKAAQVEAARALGYRCIAGRNRLGAARVMWRLNASVGARELRRIDDAYPDGPPPRSCIYYHIDL